MVGNQVGGESLGVYVETGTNLTERYLQQSIRFQKQLTYNLPGIEKVSKDIRCVVCGNQTYGVSK